VLATLRPDITPRNGASSGSGASSAMAERLLLEPERLALLGEVPQSTIKAINFLI
jgi:hypothetical protein